MTERRSAREAARYPIARGLLAIVLSIGGQVAGADEADRELKKWLDRPQKWKRDTDGPIVRLGASGSFDDTHIFAPAVSLEAGGFQMWYCGSKGRVAERVFALGLATSRDGRRFTKHPDNPVYRFGDGKHSVLTPCLLRDGNGRTVRESGRLRMWFSATWFSGSSGLHTLHETSSKNGRVWAAPSPPQLRHVYAPTVLKVNGRYRMWYVDVARDPWTIRHASSDNGRRWDVSPQPCLVVDQSWERGRLFYPTVLKIGHVFQMWYGSYWKARSQTTAIGFAVSKDGVRWRKSAHNPVLRPDLKRPWESNYVTSQSIIRLPDGSLRIWYASRKKPPFVNKYFAINTAHWTIDND